MSDDLKEQVCHLNNAESAALGALRWIVKCEDPDQAYQVNYAVDTRMESFADWTSMDLSGPVYPDRKVGTISIGKLAQLTAYAYVTGLDKIREEVRQMEERHRCEVDHLNRRLNAQAHVIERLGGAT